MSFIDMLTSSLGGMSNKLYEGLQPNFMQQTSGDQMRSSLMGEGVEGMMDKQQDYYSNLMEGNVPHALRLNIMGAGQDLAAGDAMNTSRMLAQGGVSPGSGLGAALGQVSSSQRGNEAIKNLANLSGDMMQMGQQGYDANLQDRQQLNTQAFNLDQSNLRDRNQAMTQTGGGLLSLLKMGGSMMGGPMGFLGGELLSGMAEKGGEDSKSFKLLDLLKKYKGGFYY